MGLFDKVKEQAQTLTQTATDAAQKGQEKLDQLQAKRQLDSLYRELGSITYRGAIEEVTPEVQKSETERLVSAIRAQEDQMKPAATGDTTTPGDTTPDDSEAQPEA
ncbi:hypothetical protein [Ferrimicrobium sp.]|uniref:hypothetical protein n=1 Tax=Ferrimicrobium sp. TaxID=2926050 RepID=UPI002609DE06|nr:hypothetical protein [Ferrimicrobium sp.]